MGKKTGIALLFAVLVAGGGVFAVDAAVRGTESTTALDKYTTIEVPGGGHLDSNIVAGRIAGMYHPLPWIGADVKKISCDGALPAVVGAKLMCHGFDGSKRVAIPVTVNAVPSGAVTWSFTR